MTPRRMSDIWIVIAAYKEEAVIRNVVADVTRSHANVAVVDDGSGDRTAEEAAAGGAAVVSHPINLGQGAALQTGITFALSRGAQFIVTFDADGQHQVRDIARLLQALKTHEADFALGSRFLEPGSNVPPVRRLVLHAAAAFTRVTTGLSVSDAHNGLRAMTRRGAMSLSIRQNRMAHASEILQQIADSGLRYVEVPVTISYTDYSLAKGQQLTGSIDILVDLMAERLQR
jgi:glycosyltransferase involved in cell wall biosynthesis